MDDSDEKAEAEKGADKDLPADNDDAETIKSGHDYRHGQVDWKHVHGISDDKFKGLLHSIIMAQWPWMGTITTDHCSVVRRFDGGFNHIVEMTVVMEDSHTEDYIVRVPAIGNAAHWQEGDAHNMRCEVALMKYLLKETNVPVPGIVCFEAKLNSRIGAPYTLMKRLPGRPAYASWFEKCEDRNHLSENRVSPETEAMRCNILRSLATTMVELQNIEFDKIGMPDFTTTLTRGEKPVITHSYQWAEDNAKTDDQLIPYGSFDSSKTFMTLKMEEKWSSLPDPDVADDVRTQNMLLGVRKILDIIYSNSTIIHSIEDHQDPSQKETFVLRHPDLDLQNILIDDSGNVTGIIDWEGCLAVPRCVGYSCLPEFLRRDWTSSFSLTDSPHMAFRLNHYRRIYADAILATGCSEAKYTRKSAMYRAIVDAINNDDNCSCSAPDLITKIVAQMPDFNTWDVDEMEACLGEGWEEAEEYLKEQIGVLLTPGV